MYNVMNEETGEMQNYQKFLKQESTREIWALAMCKDLDTLSQGYKGLAEGTNTFFFMSHDKIRDILPEEIVTYVRIVVDYRPQKAEPNCVRLTVGGNLFNVPGASALQHYTLQLLRYCIIVCCQQNMRVLHALISIIYISKLQLRITNTCRYPDI